MDAPLTSSPATDPVTDKEEHDFNHRLMEFLQKTLDEGNRALAGLWNQLTITYWLIVCASICTFLAGIVLISVPAINALSKDQSLEWHHLFASGFGVADLAVLFLFRPIERMQELMGNMGQIKLVINNFQDQVALRLLETNLRESETLGKAAEHINEAARDSIVLIQDYFEVTKYRLRKARAISEGARQAQLGGTAKPA